jgi:hypothetical protein
LHPIAGTKKLIATAGVKRDHVMSQVSGGGFRERSGNGRKHLLVNEALNFYLEYFHFHFNSDELKKYQKNIPKIFNKIH